MHPLRTALIFLSLWVAALPAWAEHTIAVLDFEDTTPPGLTGLDNPGFLPRTMAEILAASLARAPSLHPLERLKLRDTLKERKMDDAALASNEAKIRFAKLAGADTVVFGSFFAIDDTIRIDFSAVDVATSQPVFEDTLGGEIPGIFCMLQMAGQDLAKKLGAVPATDCANRSSEIWQDYDAALTLLDAAQYEESLAALRTLLKKYGSFPPAEHLVLAVLARLGAR